MFAVRKSKGNSSCLFFSAQRGSVPLFCDSLSSVFLAVSLCSVLGGNMRNSGNKVEWGLKLELWMLEPRRGSRLAYDASRKVGQWATGSVNAFLSLSLFLDLSSRCLKRFFFFFFKLKTYTCRGMWKTFWSSLKLAAWHFLLDDSDLK